MKAQFNFTWLFAIVAGAAILVLAVYGAVKIGDTQRYKTDTEIAKKISVITEPLQAGFAEGTFASIEFKSETKINNYCSSDDFGKNDISVATRSRIGEEWLPAGGETSVHNKYIFSNPLESGKKFYVFSKPEILKLRTKNGSIQIVGIPWPTRNNIIANKSHYFKNNNNYL